MEKSCEGCNKTYKKPYTCSKTKWAKSRFCSKRCRIDWCGFQKGHTPWHKGKYVRLSPNSEFKKGENLSEEHGLWKGEKAGIKSKHSWVKRHKGKGQQCQMCGVTREETIIDWANIDHQYKRNLDDYLELCRSCHRWYDREFNGYIMPTRW